jgi:hypothetical protein
VPLPTRDDDVGMRRWFNVLRARLVADHLLQVPDQQREGMRADDRAMCSVLRTLAASRERLVHGFHVRVSAMTGTTSAPSNHPRDVGRLLMRVPSPSDDGRAARSLWRRRRRVDRLPSPR